MRVSGEFELSEFEKLGTTAEYSSCAKREDKY